MLDQDMDRFVEEQRAKLAEERRNLDLNPSSAVSAYYTNKNQRPFDQVAILLFSDEIRYQDS